MLRPYSTLWKNTWSSISRRPGRRIELPVEASFQDIAALANIGKLLDPRDYNGKGVSAGSDVTIVVFDDPVRFSVTAYSPSRQCRQPERLSYRAVQWKAAP